MHRILIFPSEFVLQITHSLLGCSITLSSFPGLLSPPHPTLASFWPLSGGSHTTCRKVAGSHPGRDINHSEALHRLRKSHLAGPGPCVGDHTFLAMLWRLKVGFPCLTGQASSLWFLVLVMLLSRSCPWQAVTTSWAYARLLLSEPVSLSRWQPYQYSGRKSLHSLTCVVEIVAMCGHTLYNSGYRDGEVNCLPGDE